MPSYNETPRFSISPLSPEPIYPINMYVVSHQDHNGNIVQSVCEILTSGSTRYYIHPITGSAIIIEGGQQQTPRQIEADRLRLEEQIIAQQLETLERNTAIRARMKETAMPFVDMRTLWARIIKNAPDNYDDLVIMVSYIARRREAFERGNGEMRMQLRYNSYAREARESIVAKLLRRTGDLYERNVFDVFGLIHVDLAYHFGGDAMREHEYAEHYADCGGCLETFSHGDLRNVDGAALCNSCLRSEGYVYCNSCGEFTNSCEDCDHEECSARDGGGDHLYGYSTDVCSELSSFLYMPNEAAQIESKGRIPGKNLFFGIELEVLPRNHVNWRVAMKAAARALKDYAIPKADNSLDPGGFELVTVPATLEFHRKQLWNKFFGDSGATTEPAKNNKEAPAFKVRSWNTGCCGLHIHFSRAATSPMQLAKFLAFMHEPENNKFLSKIAGRDINQSSRWSWARKKKVNRRLAELAGEHYEAAAISSHTGGRTVEVRIFQGNSSRHGIMRALDFVAALLHYSGESTVRSEMLREGGKFAGKQSGLGHAAFLAWLDMPNHRGAYPDLWRQLVALQYLKTDHEFKVRAENGQFTTTRICSELSDEELAAESDNLEVAI